MLGNRRQAYAQRLPRVLSQAHAAGLDGLQQRRDTLATELSQAERNTSAVAFANARQREQLARLANVQVSLQQVGSDADSALTRERARRVSGALAWELDQTFTPRLWDAQRELGGTDAALSEARRREAALVQAQRDEPARFDAFGARIKALGPRLQALIPRVKTLQAEQQRALQELAVVQLLRQKERLAEYTSQARFAVAQLYDRASLDNGGVRANKP
jgi:hypothetical protein